MSNKICPICGNGFIEERNTKRKYCSEACLRKATINIKYIAQRAGKIQPVARDVYEAYDCKCALCGWQATTELITVNGRHQYAHGCEIHHIIPAYEGGTEDTNNLILLCPNHHKQADLGIISREELQRHAINFLEVAKQKRFYKRLNSRCESTVANMIFTSDDEIEEERVNRITLNLSDSMFTDIQDLSNLYGKATGLYIIDLISKEINTQREKLNAFRELRDKEIQRKNEENTTL